MVKPHPASGEPEKAQIAVEGADQLYRELRVRNTLTDEDGNKVKLTKGAEVEVKIEAEDAVAESASRGDWRNRLLGSIPQLPVRRFRLALSTAGLLQFFYFGGGGGAGFTNFASSTGTFCFSSLT